MKKNVVIIGAGISGLSAGVYAQRSGFNTTIYESHSIPGGASTSWKRKGYLFEGGMHWLTGSSPKIALNRVWREVGALNDEISILNRDPFFVAECGGQTACLYRDLERLKQHLISLSPVDEQEIVQLCKDVRIFFKLDMPIMDLKGVKVKNKVKMSSRDSLKYLSLIPSLGRIGFYSKLTVQEHVARFKNPAIRLLLTNVAGEEQTALATLATLATLVCGDGGFPVGGSLAMAARMADQFVSLGGKIQYNKPVSKIITENGSAKGIEVDGSFIEADAVIVTQDTLVATQTLFDKPLSDPWMLEMRNQTKPLMCTFICVGAKVDMSSKYEGGIFVADKPFKVGNILQKEIGYYFYSAKKGFAPENGTAITSIIGGDTYDYWKACKENGTYEQEKQRVAEEFIAALSKRFPQIAGNVEVWDVATPLTYERYLHSYKGSWMSHMTVGQKMKSYPSKSESLRNVYFAGQRLMPPGGLPVAVSTGRTAAQYLCRDFDVVFDGNV